MASIVQIIGNGLTAVGQRITNKTDNIICSAAQKMTNFQVNAVSIGLPILTMVGAVVDSSIHDHDALRNVTCSVMAGLIAAGFAALNKIGESANVCKLATSCAMAVGIGGFHLLGEGMATAHDTYHNYSAGQLIVPDSTEAVPQYLEKTYTYGSPRP